MEDWTTDACYIDDDDDDEDDDDDDDETLHDDDDDDADDHADDDDDNEDDNEDVLNTLFNKWPWRLLLVSTITLVLCPSLTGTFAMTHNLQRRK